MGANRDKRRKINIIDISCKLYEKIGQCANITLMNNNDNLQPGESGGVPFERAQIPANKENRVAPQSQSQVEQTQSAWEGSYKKWPTVLAVITFILTTIFAVALGPGAMVLGMLLGGMGWIVSMLLFPTVIGISFIPLSVVSLMGLAAFLGRKQARKPLTVTVMVSGVPVISILTAWLRFGLPGLNMIILTVILSACVIAQVALLIRQKTKKGNAGIKMAEKPKGLAELVILALIGLSVIYNVGLTAGLVITYINYQNKTPDAINTI
jgi:hypothetical protein